MNKENVIRIVSSHYGFFRFAANAFNHILPKNKLRCKNGKLRAGVSVFKGLKIINRGSDNEVIIGDFVRIKNSTIILRGNHNRVSIGDFSYLNDVELYTENSGNEITIGKHTTMSGQAHFAAIEGTRISIGDDCLFSSDLHFRTGDSHSILNEEGKRINPSKDIVIGDHVWIGTKVTCLKGVHVSDNSIVAATTTLCREYDQKNAVIAGVPGKVVRTGVNWCTERIPVEG